MGAQCQQCQQWLLSTSDRRLRRLRSQLCPHQDRATGSAHLGPPVLDAAAAAAIEQQPPSLAVDDLAAFVKTGFLRLSLYDVSASVHARLHSDAEALWRRSGEAFGAGLGNNVVPAVPDLLESIANSTSVKVALDRILGPGYGLYAHRFLHESGSYEAGPQSWHHDAVPQGLRPHFVMLLYYPAGASREMGPTELLPSSHAFSIDDNPDRVSQVPNFVRMGVNDEGVNSESLASNGIGRISPHLRPHQLVSDPHQAFAAIISSDLMHRGLPRTVGISEDAPWRPMLKLQFVRTRAPQQCVVLPCVDWETAAGGLGVAGEVKGMDEVWQSTWEYLHGHTTVDTHAVTTTRRQCGLSASAFPNRIEEEGVQAAITELHGAPRLGGEAERLAAAFKLGRASREGSSMAVTALARALGEAECVRRAARSGIAAAGPAVVQHLAPLCLDSNNLVARQAVEAIAECWPAGDATILSLQTVPAIIDRVMSHQLTQLERHQGGAEAAVGGAGTAWDVMAGCAKALWLLAQQCDSCELVGDSRMTMLALLSRCMDCYGTDEHVRAPDAEPDEPPPPAHRVQTSARAVRRNASLALLSLATHSHAMDNAAEQLELLRLLHAATNDREDRYVRALGMEGVCRVAQRAATEGEATCVARARAGALWRLCAARWCGATDVASPF